MTTPPNNNFTGQDGCRCVNATSTLASLSERSCTTSSDEPGVILTLRSGSCVPFHYGSNICQPHDLVYDPICDISLATQPNFPRYCLQSWCFVDKATCSRETDSLIYRSSFFPVDSGVDLFYSYDTCNSTADDWLAYTGGHTLGGIAIEAAIPNYLEPMIFKRDAEGGIIASPGPEYFNNSIPYDGVYIEFVNSIVGISEGDIKNITMTHKSRGSSIAIPSSAYTAAVYDIENGLIDMAIGPFWITGQRLKMTAFTVPLIYDKTVLVIPKPGNKNSLSYQTSKVLEPFTPGLWGVVILVIFCTALLSVWINKASSGSRQSRTRRANRNAKFYRRQFGIYARLSLDEILSKGLYFFSGGVDQDDGSSLPYKLLMFGFGFFILITISSYVANLAAFLTRSVPDYVASVEGAINAGLKICGHPALAEELQFKWPDANFVFSKSGKEFYGVLEDYQAGKCDVLAVGREDTMMDLELLDMFCDEGLLYTNSLVLENPIAFPIRPDLSSGVSYWILQGEKYHDITLTNSKSDYAKTNRLMPKCNVELSDQSVEKNVYAQIMPANMIFPIIFWIAFALTATVLQIFHMHQSKKGKRASALIGRVSTLNLFKDESNKSINLSDMEKDDFTQYSKQFARAFPKPIGNNTLESAIKSKHEEKRRMNEAEEVKARKSKVRFLEDSVRPESDDFRDNVVFDQIPQTDNDTNSTDKDDEELNSRIRELLDANSLVEFLECFHEIKKLKES